MVEGKIMSNMDLIDINEHLKFQNPSVQAKGFSVLVERLSTKELHEKKEHLKLFFDCYFNFGDVPFELLLETLPVFQKRGILSQESILEEFSARVTKIDRIRLAFANFVDVCQPKYSQFLLLAAKIDSDSLIDMCSDVHFHNKHINYVAVLLFTDILSEEQKRMIGNNEQTRAIFLKYFPKLYPTGFEAYYEPEAFLESCSPEDLLSNPLENLTVFQKLQLMQERPSLLRNLNLQSHVLYLPFMFIMCQHRKLITQAIDPSRIADQVLEIRTQLSACQSRIDLPTPDFTTNQLDLETFLSHVVNNEKIPTFVRFAEYYPEALRMLEKPYILPLLTVLLTHANDAALQKRICQLIVSFLKTVPEQAEGFILYFMSLFIKPFFNISKELVMETLPELVVNRFVIDSTVNFIILFAMKGEHRVLALTSLEKLVRKYPTVVGSVTKCANFLEDNDSEELFIAKLSLARECCIATDDCDEVLSNVSKLLSENGFRLAATIDVIKELVRNDVLELKIVRKQLSKKVHLKGNEKALAAYCRLLSLGSIPNLEETDEANNDLKVDCINELYELTKNPIHEVVSEAWKALGEFEVVDIEDAVKVCLSYGTIYSQLHVEEHPGFVDFLQKSIAKEVDSYQRPLYNVTAQASEVAPLLTKVDNYKDHLIARNKDETWFWSATLPLCGSILQLAAPSNKALTAVRLLKSCVLTVPPSTSPEDMLRLMAGWRICVREALNALAESKNNDILWARDQICQEGRLSLTQKTESIDNIMMMLTVLADVIEEKLKMIDDQKQVDEVARAQKPWIISVFEFVATRLPKEQKQKREQKVNPIYQVLTHSNKSSLFIAIFCIRLLYRNPAILEYYGDGSDLNLIQDRMFVSLLQDSSFELRKEEVPDRKMLRVTTEAYGADEMTARSFEATYQKVIDEKTEDVGEPRLEKPEDVESFFKALVTSPRDVVAEAQQKYRKVLEKFWNNGTEDVKRKIYEGLAELALISGNCRKRAKTIAIEKLPESSVLKQVLVIFDEKHNVDVMALQKLFLSFANQKRKDGKYLPPVDWLKLFERCDWKSACSSSEDVRLAIITLACEQNVSEVIYHVAAELTLKEAVIFAEHLPSVSKILPRKEFEEVLRQMIQYARSEKDMQKTQVIANSIADMQKNPIVRLRLTKELPTLESTIEVTDPILRALKEPIEFVGVVSSCFDVWLEARNGEKMNMKRICDIINVEEGVGKKTLMFGLLSHEARRLSIKKRFEKILDVITASRIARSTSSDMSSFLPIVLTLIVSPMAEDVDVPVCWFDNEDVLLQMLIAARNPFFKVLIENEEMKSNAKHIASFLRPYIDGPEADFYEPWQRVVASDFLLQLIVAFPQDAVSSILHEPDAFWKTMLPV